MASNSPSALPGGFLTTPAKEITVTRIDFSAARLTEYDGLYAIVLDNVFTPEECDTLVGLAEASSAEGWERAMINIGGGRQMLLTDERNCGRIIWDSHEVVARVWDRIAHLPAVKEIVQLKNIPRIFGNGPQKRGEVWQFSRPNERMRFLKYTGGEYFRPHCDGSYETSDRKERSYFTLHLYLNNASVFQPGELQGSSAVKDVAADPVLVGGATTFHSLSYDPTKRLDVLPKTGRVLLFQHRDLVHSGDDVVQGEKYTMRTDLLYTLASSESEGKSFMPALEDEHLVERDFSEGSDES